VPHGVLPKKASQPAQAAFRLSPILLHQSHEFDKEEFDKETVAPRLEFLDRAAGGLLFRTLPVSISSVRAC
jgi:hypothetical protein